MKQVLNSWRRFTVTLLVNVGVVLLLLNGIGALISTTLTVWAAYNGHPFGVDTLRIVAGSFNFSIGAITGAVLLAARQRIVEEERANRQAAPVPVVIVAATDPVPVTVVESEETKQDKK